MGRLEHDALWQMTLARFREFAREKEAVFWVFVFPLLLTAALGIAFRSSEPRPVVVAVIDGPQRDEVVAALSAAEGIEILAASAERARAGARAGRVDLIVTGEIPPRYRYDPTRPEAERARWLADDALQRAAGRRDAFVPRVETVSEPGSRYIDFLVPGLVGMNVMGTGIWGVGFSIANARQRKLLERFVATPMNRGAYLASHVLSRLVFLVLEVAALVGFAIAAFGVPMRGSWWAFSIVVLVASLAFSGLGLLAAARARTIEGISGIMNLILAPMWIFSGVFFSAERFPEALQPFVQALPLTAAVDVLRAVMIEGAGLAASAGELALLGVWGAGAFVVALVAFRWS